MKLLATMMLSVLAAGLILLTGFAQDEPAGDTADATQPGPTPDAADVDDVQQSEEAPLPAPGEGELGTASMDEAMTPEQELEKTRATIIEQMNLPAQRDTGTLEDWLTWMPQAASEQAGEIDFLLDFINYVTYFFTFLIVIAMVWFLIRYRAKSDADPDPVGMPTHSTSLEITWTVIPTCIVLVMFTLGFRGYLGQSIAPPNAYDVRVNGQMWSWTFTYPDGSVTTDLHLPKDRPVRFILTSSDVIHSLFIPAFRLKKDVVPGRRNSYWVTPNEVGVFEVFCTEYCGTLHSQMTAKAFVYEPDDYQEVLAEISNIYTVPFTDPPVARTPVQVGEAIWSGRGCMGCHSTDGSTSTGPTWNDLWMAERQFTDGTTAVADADYLRESILYPQRQIVAGYGNAMPSYLGQLTERDIDSVIAYIQSVSAEGKIGPDGEPVTEEESTSVGAGPREMRGPGDADDAGE